MSGHQAWAIPKVYGLRAHKHETGPSNGLTELPGAVNAHMRREDSNPDYAKLSLDESWMSINQSPRYRTTWTAAAEVDV